MSFIKEISDYVVAQSTVFDTAPSSTAVPIWIGKIGEDSPDTSVGFFETGGAAPNYVLGSLSHVRPGIQVISRSTSYIAASLNADTIHGILSVVENTDIAKTAPTTGTTRYITITPNQSPFEIGEDDKRRQLFSCNYFIQKALS